MAANGDQERNGQPQPQPQGSSAGVGGFTMSGKTLGIAGGGAAALVVVIVVVVLLVTGVFGGGGGGGASGGSDVLAYIPGDAEFVMLMDQRAVLGGDVPEDFVEFMESGGGLDDFPDSYDDLDIDDDDVATFAFVADEDYSDSLMIVKGDFEFDVIREDLEDGADCEDDDYRGFELWECPDGGAVALFEKDGYMVFAVSRQDYLEDLLTLKSRAPEKLADAEDSEIKSLLDQVGSGWLRFAFLIDECVIDRCEGMAFAIGESDDSDSIPVSYSLKFSSERAATAAEDDVEIDDFVKEFLDIRALDLDIGDVQADGEFVVGDGTAEFVDPNDASSRSSNQNGGSGSRNATPAATSAPAARAAPPAAARGGDVLAYVPAEAAGVGIFDIRAFWNGDVPDDLAEYLMEDDGDSYFALSSDKFNGLDIDDFDGLDIDEEDVSSFAVVFNKFGNVKLGVLQGDFEFDVIREELEDGLDCYGDDYRGYELWSCSGQELPAVALFEKDGYLVFATFSQDDLEDLLTLKSRTPEKLANAEDSDIKRILGQAGDGWFQVAFTTEPCVVINRCEGSFPGFSVLFAFAAQKSDGGESIPASYAMMFSSESYAATAGGNATFYEFVEELFAEFDLYLESVDGKAHGEFVIGDAIAEFVDPVVAKPGFPVLARDAWLNQCVVSYSGYPPQNPSGLGLAALPEEYCECMFDYSADLLNVERLPSAFSLVMHSYEYPDQFTGGFSDAKEHCSRHYGS